MTISVRDIGSQQPVHFGENNLIRRWGEEEEVHQNDTSDEDVTLLKMFCMPFIHYDHVDCANIR